MNKKKIISYVFDAILVGIIGLLGYVQISMIVSRNNPANHGVPSAFGKSFLYVATGSMSVEGDDNALNIGTGIVVEKVSDLSSLVPATAFTTDDGKPDYDIHTGDIVTFALTVNSITIPDTHRLIDVNVDEYGKYTFRTMGDNPNIHQVYRDSNGTNGYEEWSEDKLIGKVIYHSKALGSFLSIASPQAAADSGKTAWFFPVAILIPIVGIATYYIVDAFRKYHKEEKERQAQIDEAMAKAGIDMNNEEEVELFRMKEELRMEYMEEYERMKKKIKKDLENEKK